MCNVSGFGRSLWCKKPPHLYTHRRLLIHIQRPNHTFHENTIPTLFVYCVRVYTYISHTRFLPNDSKCGLKAIPHSFVWDVRGVCHWFRCETPRIRWRVKIVKNRRRLIFFAWIGIEWALSISMSWDEMK